jgi:hypothetical protein
MATEGGSGNVVSPAGHRRARDPAVRSHVVDLEAAQPLGAEVGAADGVQATTRAHERQSAPVGWRVGEALPAIAPGAVGVQAVRLAPAGSVRQEAAKHVEAAVKRRNTSVVHGDWEAANALPRVR